MNERKNEQNECSSVTYQQLTALSTYTYIKHQEIKMTSFKIRYICISQWVGCSISTLQYRVISGTISFLSNLTYRGCSYHHHQYGLTDPQLHTIVNKRKRAARKSYDHQNWLPIIINIPGR